MREKMCPVGNYYGHNWIIVRGTWMFWRRYKICCSCERVERVLFIENKLTL